MSPLAEEPTFSVASSGTSKGRGETSGTGAEVSSKQQNPKTSSTRRTRKKKANRTTIEKIATAYEPVWPSGIALGW